MKNDEHILFQFHKGAIRTYKNSFKYGKKQISIP